MIKNAIFAFVVFVAIGLIQVGAASAAPLGSLANQHSFVPSASRAPLQFQLFCLERPVECKASGPSEISYTSKVRNLLLSVNEQVNRQIRPRNERTDVWQISATEGDCDDYVMTKRHRLIRAGLPASALRIAVVRTREGIGHAVLIVKTSAGDYVLDNLRKTIVKHQESGYRYLRVSSADPMRWTR